MTNKHSNCSFLDHVHQSGDRYELCLIGRASSTLVLLCVLLCSENNASICYGMNALCSDSLKGPDREQ